MPQEWNGPAFIWASGIRPGNRIKFFAVTPDGDGIRARYVSHNDTVDVTLLSKGLNTTYLITEVKGDPDEVKALLLWIGFTPA